MNTLELMDPNQPATHGNDVVLLPYGLLGFEQVKNYRLLTNPAEDPFLRLQMLEDTKHSFLVLPSGAVDSNYQPQIEDEDAKFLELEDPADAYILTTVTLRNAGQTTVNLKGPIVINRRTWIGKQVIPRNAAQFSVRQPLYIS